MSRIQVFWAVTLRSRVAGVKESWPARTGVAVLPRGDIGDPSGGLRSFSRGDRCEMQLLFTQDRLYLAKTHIIREVTLLRRTQRI